MLLADVLRELPLGLSSGPGSAGFYNDAETSGEFQALARNRTTLLEASALPGLVRITSTSRLAPGKSVK